VLLDTLALRSVLASALTFDLDRRMWWPSRLSQRQQPPVPERAASAAGRAPRFGGGSRPIT
jgi:putative drug exporter of the RND superfamily